MAATSATTPAHPPDSFAALDAAPRTPTSPSSGLAKAGALENNHLLHKHLAHKPDNDPASALSPKSARARLSPGRASLPLTGQAAMAELRRRKQQQQQQHKQPEMGSRQTSPNPAVTAMQSLLGAGGMSRPEDAPAPDKLSEPLRQAAEKISVPDANARIDSESEISPASMASFKTLESTGTGGAMTATADEHTSAPGQQFVAEPAQMTNDEPYHENNGTLAVPDQDSSKNISFSYPGPPPPGDPNHDGPSRGMSLPGYGQGSPKSPASTNKRHKCPYCSTDFTRHHNLKSHLLTHSQEKPYVCQTCQARFRRLHDLKRHTKLHTGERPHTCDKCGRRFARGDALARHNKGPGGCAGRRSSLGGDEDYPDGEGPDGMDGIEYNDGEDGGLDEHNRRISEPARKRQQLETPNDPNRQVYRQHSSTYPPAPTRSMQGSMGPPQVIHPGSSNDTSPREMSGQPSPAAGSSMGGSSYYGSGQVFGEPGMMTQSPKPLSPGQPGQHVDQHRLSVVDGGVGLGRNRSTSLTTQFQQAHFGRSGPGGRTPPPPPPPPNAQFGSSNPALPHNILPPLGSTTQPQPRGGLQSSMAGPTPNMHPHHQQGPPPPPQGSNPGSLSSHGRSSGSSMRDLVQQNPNDLWDYVRALEQRFSRMQDEYELRISRLQEEVISLKGQVGQMSNAPSYSSDMGRQGPYPGPPQHNM